MSIAKEFLTLASQGTDLSVVMEIYKKAARKPDGYLHTTVFKRMRDGTDDRMVKKFFSGPFAEIRIWLPAMFGLYISRFPDHPYTYVVADNLSDEYGKYFGHSAIESSHAQLYRRVLDVLGVEVIKETMTTPAKFSSHAAEKFHEWFHEKTLMEKPSYMIGHFLAYEITDVLDFPDYTIAAKRMWPENRAVHEFFSQHAESGHDAVFARDLQPLFEKNRAVMISAMGNLLERWTTFYRKASKEIQ